MRDVRISAAKAEHLPALVEALGQEPYFTAQLARQRTGHGVLLIAWLRSVPVGDVYLWLGPAEEPELRERLPGVPIIMHLEVALGHRGKLIGTQLVQAAEERLRRLGHARVALGVDPVNLRGYRLYLRLGYAEWPHPPVNTIRHVFQEDGDVERVPDVARILVKELREPGVPRGLLSPNTIRPAFGADEDGRMTTRQHAVGDLLRRSAARFPHKTAIVFGGTRWTYAELDR
jgi:GNAT superfamily N-acetyltransferase